jgi:septal ring factor EnvC (AmiA/AmiB activator)
VQRSSRLLLFLISCGCAVAGQAAPTPALDRLTSAVERTLDALERGENQLAQARDQSFMLARALTDATRQQREAAARIARKSNAIDTMKENLAQLRHAQQAARARYLASARARYLWLRAPRAQYIVELPRMPYAGRQLAYYDFIAARYQRDRGQALSTLNHVAATAAALSLETESLRQLRAQLANELDTLAALRDRQTRLVAAVEAGLRDAGVRAREGQRDQAEVAALVDGLAALGTSAGFATRKGQLAWPASGQVLKMPGGALREGGAKWPGVFISTATATPVKAVAGGRIVYAEWFRNLGRLVIVDHGDGYMSLYGNNAEILHQVGDEIAAGDTLAMSGISGEGLPEGIYFELREAGRPIDPRVWCQTDPHP